MVTTRSGAKLGAVSKPDKRRARARKLPSSPTDVTPDVPKQGTEVTATAADSESNPSRELVSEYSEGGRSTDHTLETSGHPAVEEARLSDAEDERDLACDATGDVEGEPNPPTEPSVEELALMAVAAMKKHLSITSGLAMSSGRKRRKKKRSVGSREEGGVEEGGSSGEGGRLPDYMVLDSEATSSKRAGKRKLKTSSKGYILPPALFLCSS